MFLSQAVLPLQAAGLDLYVVAAGGVRERMDEEAVDNARRVAQQQALLWQQRNLPPKPAKGSDTEHVGRAQGQGRHRSAVGDGGDELRPAVPLEPPHLHPRRLRRDQRIPLPAPLRLLRHAE